MGRKRLHTSMNELGYDQHWKLMEFYLVLQVRIQTVLPNKAMAKISMRLVPDQDPFEVKQQFTEYLKQNSPPAATWKLEQLAAAYPSITDRSSNL